MSVKSIDKRLYDMGITLPEPAAPVASYVATVEHGGLLRLRDLVPALATNARALREQLLHLVRREEVRLQPHARLRAQVALVVSG